MFMKVKAKLLEYLPTLKHMSYSTKMMLGLERKVILGKYSGVNTITYKLNTLGIKINRKEAEELAEIIRDKTISLKRALFDSEIIDTYKSYKGRSDKSKEGKREESNGNSKK